MPVSRLKTQLRRASRLLRASSAWELPRGGDDLSMQRKLTEDPLVLLKILWTYTAAHIDSREIIGGHSILDVDYIYGPY